MRIVLLFSLCLLMCGCSGGIEVTSDYDQEANFSRYKNFTWISNVRKQQKPKIKNSLTNKHIKRAIQQSLMAKGLTYVDNKKADLIVTYYISVQNKLDVSTIRYGPWRRWGPRHKEVRRRRYKEGTLVIDFIDPRLKQVVWQGLGIGVISKTQNRAEHIQNAVSSILKKYPPKK